MNDDKTLNYRRFHNISLNGNYQVTTVKIYIALRIHFNLHKSEIFTKFVRPYKHI